MRRFGWILIALLLPVPCAKAAEFFGDFLYWQTTEPVDWVLKTNYQPADQYYALNTISFDFTPGFRVGMGFGEALETKVYYTRVYTSAADSASGYISPAFLGGKFALGDLPASDPPFYNHGQVDAAVDYNVLDWDLGKRYTPFESLEVRPLVGLKAAWINQKFDSEFRGYWSGVDVSKDLVERIENDFWGIGLKFGVENNLNVWRGERCEINCVVNFYTAYLLGFWTVKDASDLTTVQNGQTTFSQRVVPIDNRDFGALTFQAIIGINLKSGRWSATAGYELNDWLNQCQIFDDATGPHNNDLILHGLTVNVSCCF